MDPQKTEIAGQISAETGAGDRTEPQGWWTTGRRKLLSTGLLAIAGILAAVISVWAVQSGGGPAFTAGITVAKIVNRVETDRPGRSGSMTEQFLPAVIGQGLLPGDGVRTYVNSEARVDIKIQGHTRVSRTRPNTIWRLGQFSLEEGTIIELDEGKIFLFDDAAGPAGQPLKIVTPAGTASPRGTWMSFSYDPISEVAELQCFRGSCLLENEFGSQLVRDEQKSSITRLAPPVAPVEMEPEETQEFLELPEALTGEVIIPAIKPIPETTVDVTPISAASVQNQGGDGTGSSGSPRDLNQTNNPTLEPKATVVAQPTPEPTRVSEPTATPRPTPEPTIQKTPDPTPKATLKPTVPPTLTPTPKPVDILLPPVNASQLPHVFVGSATIDSVVAPDGTEVSVWIEGYSEPLASALVFAGDFTVIVPQYGAESFGGRMLLFRLDGLTAMPEAVWSSGAADLLSLKAEIY